MQLPMVLMVVQDLGHIHCMPPRMRGDSDPHVIALWELFSLPDSRGGQPLLACHIYISHCFWSLILPPQYRQSFCIRVDDTVYAFQALPFGWAYSPMICQDVLTDIVRRARMREIVVLIYYDDMLVIGFGSFRVKPAADAIVALCISKGPTWWCQLHK